MFMLYGIVNSFLHKNNYSKLKGYETKVHVVFRILDSLIKLKTKLQRYFNSSDRIIALENKGLHIKFSD